MLRDLGKFENARDLLPDALEADQKTFQPGHPSIAIRQTNLGMVLADLEEFDEASELLTLAYHVFLENLGPGHPNTKIVKGNLKGVIREWAEKENDKCRGINDE